MKYKKITKNIIEFLKLLYEKLLTNLYKNSFLFKSLYSLIKLDFMLLNI
jgi:hypothetical protein